MVTLRVVVLGVGTLGTLILIVVVGGKGENNWSGNTSSPKTLMPTLSVPTSSVPTLSVLTQSMVTLQSGNIGSGNIVGVVSGVTLGIVNIDSGRGGEGRKYLGVVTCTW